METYDLIVLGGGPAGYTAALEAAKSGVRVALVEEDELGGTCLNRGCIPTKIFLESVDVLEKIEAAEHFAIDFSGCAKINRKKLLERKQSIVASLKDGLRMMISSSSIEVIAAKGVFAAEDEILIKGEKTYSIKGKKIILSTGTREAFLKIDGNEFIMGSTQALELKTIPQEVCIIGGGVIGVELATFYSGMGCRVIIVEALDDILGNLDREMAAMLQENLLERGVEIHVSSIVSEIKREGSRFQVTYSENGTDAAFCVDAVINATGRIPNTEGIGLEKAGVKLDQKGYITVDEYLETSAKGIYAAGDVTGGILLAHAAFDEGTIAARNAVKAARILAGRKAIPSCIYTHPEMASVGMTEEQAKAAHKKLRKGYFPMSANGRSLAAGNSNGMIKVITDEEIGQIIGIHMIGENVTEVLGAAAVAIEGEYTCDEFAELIIAHPTVCEALKDAMGNCVRNKMK